MAVAALSSQETEKLVEKAYVVNGDGKFDVTAVARAAVQRAETACCASTESAEPGAIRQDGVGKSLHVVQEGT